MGARDRLMVAVLVDAIINYIYAINGWKAPPDDIEAAEIVAMLNKAAVTARRNRVLLSDPHA